MLIYCAHEYGGKWENIQKAGHIINKLQRQDLENTYISPIHAFSYLGYNEIGYEQELELCGDLLMMCDEMLICSEISKGMKWEIDLAKKLNIPIKELE